MNTFDGTIIGTPATPPNPLSHPQTSQLNAFLGFMWMAIAGAGAVVWLVSGQALFLQVMTSLGIVMTGLTLYQANAFTYRNLPVNLALSARHVSWRAQPCR